MFGGHAVHGGHHYGQYPAYSGYDMYGQNEWLNASAEEHIDTDGWPAARSNSRKSSVPAAQQKMTSLKKKNLHRKPSIKRRLFDNAADHKQKRHAFEDSSFGMVQ